MKEALVNDVPSQATIYRRVAEF